MMKEAAVVAMDEQKNRKPEKTRKKITEKTELGKKTD